ncbi:MAG TPA: CDGSH iron-sulfur domain-containing protein [Thermodesulfobacteriota bacterium]|nr:CDGSH iron-sulfur domain-containing protein [Thermodesulfobacteriota bacterium]
MGGISRINVLDDGPLVAEGLDKLSNSKGEELELGKKLALCRCGASGNKPFCDGSHKAVNFNDEKN